ncbi:MAG: hypothetical protein C0497_14015 [Gemmatimonas sp.]|nr:hypothetical protein [Gemmatimonas sp.]
MIARIYRSPSTVHRPPFTTYRLLPRFDHIRIPVGPGELHAERFGFGDHPLVLLHGFGTSSFLWRRVAPALPLGRVTAWAMDLLGHGESDRPANGAFGVAAQALWVEQAMTSLRIGRATVVGVDLGAAVTMHLAATRPARVYGLVLISPPPPGHVRGEDLAEFGRLTGTHLFEATRGMFGAAAVLRPLLSRGVASPEAMPDKLVARYAAPFVGPDGVRHLQALANAVTDDDAEELDLGRITARTLVLRGERDAWCTPADAARVATAVPGAEVRTVPLAGRLVPEDAPDALASLLADWAPPLRSSDATPELPVRTD